MWTYQEKIFDESMIGENVAFVYIIKNTMNDKCYIGKKLFQFTKTKKIKGKRKRVKIQSDWQEYYGSNKKLQEDVASFGEKYFVRTILYLCKSKGTANYLELKEQILHGALESDKYYNDQIHVRVHRSHIKL
jgi:hypothetical protein